MKEFIHKIDAFNDKIEYLENSIKMQIEHMRSEMRSKIICLKLLIPAIVGVIMMFLIFIWVLVSLL